MKIELTTNSAHETYELGKSVGGRLHQKSIVALYGDLAAGKTTFIKGLASSSCGIEENEINSPTFTFLNIYEGLSPFYHFDLYRLKSAQEFFQMGFEEYFEAGGICCIEWASVIKGSLPSKRIDIHFEHLNGDSRKILISSEYEEISF